MTKGELLKMLQSFTDDIEIFRYDPNDLADERETIKEIKYVCNPEGLGQITLK